MKKLFLLAAILCIVSAGCTSNSTSTSEPDPTWTKGDFATKTTILSICFPSSSIAYACGMNGTILKSIDGGSTWNALSTNSKESLYKIRFYDVNHGIAGGNNGALLKTTDGGATWDNIGGDILSEANLRDLIYTSDKRIIVVGATQGVGFTQESTNDGSKWASSGGSSAVYGIASLHDPLNNSYVEVGLGRESLLTTDFGKTWDYSTMTTYPDFMSVDFFDSQNGFATSFNRTILKSTDGAKSWVDGDVLTKGGIRTVRMLSPSETWAAGENGIILRTTNSGSKWDTLTIAGFSGSWNDIAKRDPAHIAFVGDSGTLYWLNP